MKALNIKNLAWIDNNKGYKLIRFETEWELDELVYIEYADLYDLFKVRFGHYEGNPVIQLTAKTEFTFVVPEEWSDINKVPFFSIYKATAKKAGLSNGEVATFPERMPVSIPVSLGAASFALQKNLHDVNSEERKIYGGKTLEEFENEL